MVRRSSPVLLVVLFAAACSAAAPEPVPAPSGPPTVRLEVVQRHAEQFDEDVPQREAGSQQEFAAASYITGHLQQAGYVVRLDAVPVGDLVRSSNVVALPPSRKPPAVVVSVPYDTGAGQDANGAPIGLFLEVARALRSAAADHSVEFVALGAERAEVGDGRLGSRRLAKLLLDEELDPLVVTIGPVGEGEAVTVGGERAAKLASVARAAGLAVEEGGAGPTAAVFAQAGFESASIGGDPSDAAQVLMRFLTEGAD